MIPLCDACRLKWEREKGEACPDCGLDMMLCRCTSARVRQRGVSDTVKLVNYYADRETVGRRSILYMKKHAKAEAFSFFAKQLSYSVKKYMETKALSAQQVAFCYVPRGRKNVAVFGFDQSERMCRFLAHECGAKHLRLISRTRRFGAKDAEQKKLSGKQREENVKGKFVVNKKRLPDLKDVRCLFLVDDVVTTGASVCGCAECLKPFFKGEVVSVAVARTPTGRRTRRF